MNFIKLARQPSRAIDSATLFSFRFSRHPRYIPCETPPRPNVFSAESRNEIWNTRERNRRLDERGTPSNFIDEPQVNRACSDEHARFVTFLESSSFRTVVIDVVHARGGPATNGRKSLAHNSAGTGACSWGAARILWSLWSMDPQTPREVFLFLPWPRASGQEPKTERGKEGRRRNVDRGRPSLIHAN